MWEIKARSRKVGGDEEKWMEPGKAQWSQKRQMKAGKQVEVGMSNSRLYRVQYLRNRRAQETLEERYKRLYKLRLNATKKRMRNKLTEGGASTQQVCSKIFQFESNIVSINAKFHLFFISCRLKASWKGRFNPPPSKLCTDLVQVLETLMLTLFWNHLQN